MTAAGKRNRRIRFERKVDARTDEGVHEEQGWQKIESALARVFYGTGAERRNGAAEGATQVATFNVYSTTKLRGVTVADCRIFDMDYKQPWDITAVAPGKPGELEFTATQVRG
ncbi:phage head completion protein [Sphingomonas sp. OTU376]|uniref:phage head completion protein n=1 Tax=Sphingomonas sp. OTU376 TaxID=3043863 RepID=UPI00313EB97D